MGRENTESGFLIDWGNNVDALEPETATRVANIVATVIAVIVIVLIIVGVAQ